MSISFQGIRDHRISFHLLFIIFINFIFCFVFRLTGCYINTLTKFIIVFTSYTSAYVLHYIKPLAFYKILTLNDLWLNPTCNLQDSFKGYSVPIDHVFYLGLLLFTGKLQLLYFLVVQNNIVNIYCTPIFGALGAKIA